MTADYCTQRGVLKLDYPLVGDAFDPMDAACHPLTPLHLWVFFHLFRAKDGIVVEMTPKPFHPQITMVSDSHMWTENKVTGIINAFERDALESTFE